MDEEVFYVLTDGHEIMASRAMTPNEARKANREARCGTDGNLYWRKAQESEMDEIGHPEGN